MRKLLYDISQDYKNYRRIYLELNIGFMSFFSLAIKFILEIVKSRFLIIFFYFPIRIRLEIVRENLNFLNPIN